jgi:hypothetical protein
VNDLARENGIAVYLSTVRGRGIVCVRDLEISFVKGL